MLMPEENQVQDAPPEAPVEDTKPTDTKDKNYIMFPVPQGYEVPDEAKDGKEFDAVATLKVNPNGEICLVSLDGSPVESEDESKENPEEEKTETPEEENKEESTEDTTPSDSFTQAIGKRFAKMKG